MENESIIEYDDDGFKIDDRQKKIFELINSRPAIKPTVIEEEINKFNELTAKRSVSYDGTDYNVSLYLLTTYPEDVKTTKVRVDLTESNFAKERVVSHHVLLNASNLHDAAEEIRNVARNGDYPKLDETTSLLITTLLNQKLDETLQHFQGAKFTDLRDQVRLGNFEAAEVFLARGADINSQLGLTGNTLLHEMSGAENIEAITWLLSKGADTSIKNNEGQTFWDKEVYAAIREGGRALEEGDADKLNQSLDKLRAIVSMENSGDVNAKKSFTHSPLHEAILSVNDYAIPTLVSNGANINAQNKNGDTPLHIAAKDGWTDGIRILLESGADISIRNTAGKSATDVLEEKYKVTNDEAFSKLKEMVEAFGEKKRIEKSIQQERTEWMKGFSTDTGSAKAMQSVYATDAEKARQSELDMNLCFARGRLSPMRSHPEDISKAWDEIKDLIEAGANPNFQHEKVGEAVIHSIVNVKEDATDKVKWLLEHGADINLKTLESGTTPLMIAVGNENKELTVYLLSQGADSSSVAVLNGPDFRGSTAKSIAEKMGNSEIVEIIDAHDEKKVLDSSMSKKFEPQVKKRSQKL